MEADLKWIAGIGISLALALATTLVGAFRNLNSKISISNRELYARIDRIKEHYVRRDDLDGHLQRIDTSLHEIRDEMRHNNEKIMQAIENSKK